MIAQLKESCQESSCSWRFFGFRRKIAPMFPITTIVLIRNTLRLQDDVTASFRSFSEKEEHILFIYKHFPSNRSLQ